MKILKYLFCASLIILGLTACSDDDDTVSVAPAPSAGGTWTDERDGTEYTWVRYGNLEWTTCNLSYKPSAGITKPATTSLNPGQYDDGVSVKYYETFGLLYDFEAAEAAVPDGWRLPTVSDWNDLDSRTGGDIKGAIGLQLGGYYLSDDYFQLIHPDIDYYAYIYGFYWTGTTDESKTGDSYAFYRKLTYNRQGSICESMDKTNYMNVRLVRDAN